MGNKTTLGQVIDNKIKYLSEYVPGKDKQQIIDGIRKICKDYDKEQKIKEYDDKMLSYMNKLENFIEDFSKKNDTKDKLIKEELEKLNILYENKNKEVTNKSDETKVTGRTKQESNNNNQTNPEKSGNQYSKPNSPKQENNATKSTVNVDFITREIQNLQKKLLDPISSITSQVQTTLAGVGMIEKEFKKLADDIVYKITKANKDQSTLSEIEESVSTLPAKMNKVENILNQIDSKLDSVGSQRSKAIPFDIPEDEKAILELSRYMQDGLEQLENIARYHISKQREIEKTEKKASDIDSQIEKVKNDAYMQGQRDAQIKLVKSIYNKHPSKFEEIRSVFEDIVTEKYAVDEIITVTDENKQTLEVTIDGIKEIGEYTIETVALMIDDETLVSASVKKIEN